MKERINIASGVIADLSQLVGWERPPINGVGELTKDYFIKYLPDKISKHTGESPNQIRQRLKNSHLDAATFTAILENIGGDTQRSRVFFEDVLPSILAKSSLDRSSSQSDSLKMGLVNMSKSIAESNLTIMSPLCPPYHYNQDGKTLKHASPQILPTIGDRFEITLQSLRETFEPLTEAGVEVNFEFYTYTGETRNMEHLTDLGQDAVQYYNENGTTQLFENLQSATQDARNKISYTLSGSSINADIISIESSWGGHIQNYVSDFINNFGAKFASNRNYNHIDRDIEKWLKDKLNISSEWLECFAQEELAYRQKQAKLITQSGKTEPLLVSALKEAMLYLVATSYADQNNRVIFDLETTTDYMVSTLRHKNAPVIMGAGYNHRNPYSKYNIRQPFNTPS